MEYTRFGEGFIRRENADKDWEPCDEGDVPEEDLLAMLKVELRKKANDPDPGELELIESLRDFLVARGVEIPASLRGAQPASGGTLTAKAL